MIRPIHLHENIYFLLGTSICNEACQQNVTTKYPTTSRSWEVRTFQIQNAKIWISIFQLAKWKFTSYGFFIHQFEGTYQITKKWPAAYTANLITMLPWFLHPFQITWIFTLKLRFIKKVISKSPFSQTM